jgi:MFS family permease
MSDKIWTRDFLLLSLSNFLMFLSFFFLLSALPLYMVNELKAREEQVGLLIGMFTVAAVIVRPYAGMMLDKLGRRRVILVSMALFSLATAGYLLAGSVLMLLLLRLFHGAAFGVSTTAQGTLAADLVPASRRGEGLGYFGTFTVLAMVIGPALGLTVSRKMSFESLFTVSLLFSLVSWGTAALIRYPRQQEESLASLRFRLSDWLKMIEPRAFPYSLPLVGLAVVFGGIVSFIPLYSETLGGAELAGGFYVAYALALVGARVVSGKVFDRRGPDLVVYPGILSYVVGLSLLAATHGPVLLYLAGAFIGAGYGSIQPCLQALVIRDAPESRRGAATATFFIAVDVGIGLGSFFLGFVAGSIGYRGMFAFVILFVLLSGLLYLRARRKEERTVSEMKKVAEKLGA